MAEYTPALEAHLIERLRTAGFATAEDLPGLSPEEAADILRRFAERWSHTGALDFDGATLRAVPPAPQPQPAVAPPVASPEAPATPPVVYPTLSPVDQVLSSAGQRSALDTPPSESAPKALWLLPVAFGLLGGLGAWLVARHESPRSARRMFVLGGVVQLVTACMLAMVAPGITGMFGSGGPMPASASWPPMASGKPAFYYFGTAT